LKVCFPASNAPNISTTLAGAGALGLAGAGDDEREVAVIETGTNNLFFHHERRLFPN
jgi:hypothetical protein